MKYLKFLNFSLSLAFTLPVLNTVHGYICKHTVHTGTPMLTATNNLIQLPLTYIQKILRKKYRKTRKERQTAYM
jgi:hypothetical protein